MLSLLNLLVFIGVVSSREFSDEEYYQLPELFELDEVERCFSQDGLYCVGTFRVTPLHENDTLYKLMKEYSSTPHKFNRTLIHRGYCVTTRCPDNSTLRTSSQYFEHCAAEVTSELSLRTHLDKLNYCHRRVQDAFVFDTWKLTFLIVICALFFMNFIGTVYDLLTRNKEKKAKMLMIWSVRESWEQLTSIQTQALNSPLAALHGIRVCVTICVCVSHAALIHFTVYTQNPRNLEQLVTHPLAMLIQNSTSVEQMFFVISGFLHTYQLRKRSNSDQEAIGCWTTLILIAKRIFRLYPVYIITVGFVASWWSDLSSGPLWPALVGEQQTICRHKFWTHALFVNNLVEPEKLCVLTTWYMAVDIQLYLISTIILVVLMRLPVPKLPVLVTIFIGSCLLNAALAYAFDWSPMLYLNSAPENLRTLFRDQPSFSGLYISPWGNLPACLLGAILGYLYFDMKGRKFHFARHKCILTTAGILAVPFIGGWLIMGYFLQHIKMKAFIVAYTAVERSVYQVFLLITYAILNQFIMKLVSWRGWHVLSRVSYSVMLVHWLVTLHIVASTPQPLNTSVMDIGIHGLITSLYTFIVAGPITILLEIPIKRSFDYITS